jgi:hypothetical protein
MAVFSAFSALFYIPEKYFHFFSEKVWHLDSFDLTFAPAFEGK